MEEDEVDEDAAAELDAVLEALYEELEEAL